MNKKLLTQVNQAFQAEAISLALQNAGIDFEIQHKAREYSSIVTGIDSTTIDIFVDEKKFIEAAEILRKISSQDSEPGDELHVSKNFFRRVIAYSIIGAVILPVVFNIFATISFFQMKQQHLSTNQRTLAFAVLLFGWLLGFTLLLFLLRPQPLA